jgi:hypothetical protein
MTDWWTTTSMTTGEETFGPMMAPAGRKGGCVMRHAFPVLLAATLALASNVPAVATSHLVAFQSRVWRVGPGSQIEPFPYVFPSSYDASILGSTLPTPSPDGQWIAFGRFDADADYDIHLLNVKSGQEHRISYFGQRPKRGYTYADALIAAWSPDSRHLLFVVAPGETTSEEGELAIPKAPYGFYVYSLITQTTQRVSLPKGFQVNAWLPGGRFLGVLPARRAHEEDKLVILRPGRRQEVAIKTSVGVPNQARATADGKWLVGVVSSKRRGTAEIIKINLATMSVRRLVSLRSFTGNERPALSPDARSVAYKEQIRRVKGIPPQERLFVNSRNLYSCPAPLDFQWIDDQRIAVECQDQVLVLNTAGGQH